MDLLRSAYSNSSDEEPEPAPARPFGFHPPPPKRPRPENRTISIPAKSNRSRPPPTEAPVHGRYVSKRERALLGSGSPSAAVPDHPDTTAPSASTSAAVSCMGSLLDSDLPSDVLSLLRHQTKGHGHLAHIQERLSVALKGHTKAVNTIQWSESHAHLLASASMDHKVFIWNVWSKNHKKARILSHHNAAVKDVKWSKLGWHVLSCGYDCTSRLVDIEKGIETQVFKEDQVVSVVKFHPDNFNLFLSGGAKGQLRLWDVRTGKATHQYIRQLGPILDLEFSLDGKQFISSSDVSFSNISENAVIVWDVSRQVPLSNQVYGEAYTCTCIRHHPTEPCFVAQSNGNYIALFSSNPPFRLDKYKRYEGHGVSGFPIKCNFSLDGEMLATGSSEGSIYFYKYGSSELLGKTKAYTSPCVDVAFHPTMSNFIAVCSWAGDISVFE
ncbi:WD repeat-containing protein 25 isoform X2 [Eucalyptus grandis]|uniref:WD repeat-containing protein 25 isoform X2 n=1 Tax=Eucalyptus grandis TaxID=71139 RepID=UPI00192EE22F|nr:WD repeat-containing protein 25 isoform X2 [Eucalyptus grandis]